MNKYLFLVFFFIVIPSVLAQTDSLRVKYDKSIVVQKKFNEENLKQYKEQEAFIYTEEVKDVTPSLLTQFFNWLGRLLLRFLEWIFGVKYAKGIFVFILEALPYVIAGIMLLLLLKFFLKTKSNSVVSSAKNTPVISITEEEELVKNKDILQLIKKAVAQNNYRLAIRYYYLHTLQQLEAKELIVWEPQKTNDDYIKEISIKELHQIFKEITHLYDFVWYGNFTIDEITFSKVQSDFKNINKYINTK